MVDLNFNKMLQNYNFIYILNKYELEKLISIQL